MTNDIKSENFPRHLSDTSELLNEYAKILRGEHPGWKGDAVLNGERFAFEIGRLHDDADDIAKSASSSRRELSILSDLPPSSVDRFVARIRRGIGARKGGA